MGYIIDQLHNNQFLITGIFGALTASSVYILRLLYVLIKRKLTITITTSDRDANSGYWAIERYIENLGYNNTNKDIILHVKWKNGNIMPYSGLNFGTHYMWHKNKFTSITHTYVINENTVVCKFTVSMFPCTNTKLLDTIMDDISKKENNYINREPYLWMMVNGTWRGNNIHYAKSLDQVHIPLEDKLRLINDIDGFIASKDWYSKNKLMYKRGYLFYGEPGCGKSTIIKSIAIHLTYQIYYFSLSTIKDDEQLLSMYHDVEENSIMIFEDIDCVTDIFDDKITNRKAGVTLGTLLNILDGALSKPNIITIITTNHIEKIPPALLRAGRCDFKLEFKPLNKDIAEQMFHSYYPDLPISTDIQYPIVPVELEHIILDTKNKIQQSKTNSFWNNNGE